MKTYLLIGSALSSVAATLTGIVGVLNQDVTEQAVLTAVKSYQIAGILGLLGISLFFVGIAFPKTEGVK